jgi:hypothetical protein
MGSWREPLITGLSSEGGGEGGTALPTDVNNPHLWRLKSSSSFFQTIHQYHFPLYAEPEKTISTLRKKWSELN